MDMMCGKCKGGMKIVTGLLLLLNAYVWPLWMGIDGWVAWVAILMVLGGVLKFVLPACPHCAAMCSGMMESGAKKKK